MRTFIAVELSSELKQHLGDIARQLRPNAAEATWVKPDNLHLTLKFLGDIDESLLPQLAEQIDQLTRQQGAFSADLNGFGFFPSPKRPRILYAAIKEPLPFKQLAQHLDRLLEPLGFARDQHFHPHITLARLKSCKNFTNLQPLMDDIDLRHPFAIRAISLCSSTLQVAGAHYQVLQRSLLQDSGI